MTKAEAKKADAVFCQVRRWREQEHRGREFGIAVDYLWAILTSTNPPTWSTIEAISNVVCDIGRLARVTADDLIRHERMLATVGGRSLTEFAQDYA